MNCTMYQIYTIVSSNILNIIIILGKMGIGIFIAVNVIGMPLYMQNWRSERKRIIEAKSRELAAFPILFAENDRTQV